MKNEKFNIQINTDFIQISLQDGREVAFWHRDEWEEDPLVVLSIVNAVRMSFEDPKNLMDICKHHIESQNGQND